MLLALALCLSAVTPLQASDSFLAELEDLPLAPGLSEVPGGLLFDSADGRIVEATAVGAVSVEQVRGFYQATLQQLGWQPIADLQFRRDNEGLRLVFETGPTLLTVHFKLAPIFLPSDRNPAHGL